VVGEGEKPTPRIVMTAWPDIVPVDGCNVVQKGRKKTVIGPPIRGTSLRLPAAVYSMTLAALAYLGNHAPISQSSEFDATEPEGTANSLRSLPVEFAARASIPASIAHT
jgi:hypothetical protein